VTPASEPPAQPASDDFQLIDFTKLRDYGLFLIRAPLRHPWAALGTFLSVLGLTAAALAVLPRSYRAESEIMAQRNLVMPALGNPGRSVPFEADAPTRAASEIIRRRDNLVSLIKQTGLLDRWEVTRSPAGRAKDWVMRLFRGPPTEEDRVDSLVGMLEERLWVNTGEGTVSLGVDWPDAQLAAQLVETAQQNFLEARHAAEVSSIAESISILERHAAAVQESINTAMEEVKRARGTRAAREAPPRPAQPRVGVGREGGSSGEANQLKIVLDGKRRAIRDLEDYRKRRLAELQAELAQQKLIFADAHPTIVRLKQSIAALTEDSPQLMDLRREERDIAQEYARLAGQAPAEDREGSEDRELRPSAVLPQARRLLEGPEATAEEYAKARLRFTIGKYESLVERIDAARIELDTARAAFKYRYSVLNPAQVPKSASKPKIPVVIAVGALAALALALLVAALLDWRGGRLIERWQVERVVGVPFLGQLQRS
jgi:uncharacterized protein involved in exopolysaccharide biosynthesis